MIALTCIGVESLRVLCRCSRWDAACTWMSTAEDSWANDVVWLTQVNLGKSCWVRQSRGAVRLLRCIANKAPNPNPLPCFAE